MPLIFGIRCLVVAGAHMVPPAALAVGEFFNGLLVRLKLERETTLKALHRAFEFARESLRSSQHTVFLYLTSDGRTPRLALRLDDISDIRGYELEDAVPLDAIELPPGAIPKDLIQSYLRGAAGDALLLAPESLLRLAERAAAQAGLA